MICQAHPLLSEGPAGNLPNFAQLDENDECVPDPFERGYNILEVNP
jgi:hypothetical protein